MVHVDPANYPATIPAGGYHHDVDDVDDYRLPKDIDNDFFLYMATPDTGPARWMIAENARVTPHPPTTD